MRANPNIHNLSSTDTDSTDEGVPMRRCMLSRVLMKYKIHECQIKAQGHE